MGPKKGRSPKPLRKNRRIKDRGAGIFFHGREDHRKFVRSILDSTAESRQDGTAVVFQGPPGAGKTALLARMVSEAEAVGWRCVEINPQVLAEPDVMAQSLGNAYVQRRGESVDADAMSVKSGLDKTIAGTRTVGGILRDCLSRRARLVLILDEAQHLGDPMSQVRAESLRDALKSIINGHTGRKTVLLMGGLGHTWDAMRKRGASRLEDDCVRNLGRVSDNPFYSPRHRPDLLRRHRIT
ncbi:MAG: ATP-binding protein, partial [Bacteroidota bacterium]|nr:ATP-binding protein [Bacteroidota bacterium]